jgi:hypothetical protein
MSDSLLYDTVVVDIMNRIGSLKQECVISVSLSA